MGIQKKIFRNHHFAEESFRVMNELRMEEKLCDVILKVDKSEFYVHKIVLAAVSPYLKAMFTNGMLESLQKEISIQGIDEKTMELLVDFSYTGKLEINVDNVQQLLAGASLLNIDRLRTACSRFLQKQLDSANCIGIRSFAAMYSCEELEQSASDYLNQHFLSVINYDEFLQLKFDKVINLLNSDKIQVRSEENVYDALENWLYHEFDKRIQYVPEILKCIRFPLLSLEFLQYKVYSASFIKSSTNCQLILAEVMNENPEKLPVYLRTPRALPQSIYAVGGRNSIYCQLDTVERYDIYLDEWHEECNMNIARTAVGAACLNGMLYAVAGERAVNEPHEDTLYLPYVECYNPGLHQWFPVTDLSVPRSFVCVVVCNGELYALGGEDRTSSYDIVEKYSVARNCWFLVKSMQKRRAGAGVTEHEGILCKCIINSVHCMLYCISIVYHRTIVSNDIFN